MNNNTLIIEQEYNAPIELVWRAITEVELMSKWFFEIPELILEVGSEFHFEGGEEGKRYMHLCKILEIEIEKKLKFSWKYQGEEGLSFVTIELSSLENKTKLKLIHEGLDTFTNPDFIRDNFVEGWQYLLHESLKELLEKGKALRYW